LVNTRVVNKNEHAVQVEFMPRKSIVVTGELELHRLEFSIHSPLAKVQPKAGTD
jgi:hypothetical protein